MFAVIDSIKRQFHSDLVADPAVHAFVLNLYLGGERYPQKVCDYFQAEFAPTEELSAALQRHASDENRHVRIFTHAIESLEQPVVELGGEDIFNEVIRSFTPGTFHIVKSDDRESANRKLANFMAHAHFLEKRVARSFVYHLEACDRAGKSEIVNLVERVKRDEERHVQYTRESVYDLLTRREADAVMAVHRRVEAKANLLFSQGQVKNILGRFSKSIPVRRKFLYRICALVMEGAGEYA